MRPQNLSHRVSNGSGVLTWNVCRNGQVVSSHTSCGMMMVDGGRGGLPGIMVLGQRSLRQETGSCLFSATWKRFVFLIWAVCCCCFLALYVLLRSRASVCVCGCTYIRLPQTPLQRGGVTWPQWQRCMSVHRLKPWVWKRRQWTAYSQNTLWVWGYQQRVML